MTKELKYIYKRFPHRSDCIVYLESLRWPNEVRCPYCLQSNFIPFKSESRYHCNVCNASFSVTVKTALHKSRLDLQKWFYTIALAVNTNGEITSRQLGEEIEVTKDTAWSMLKRIRESFTADKDFFLTIAKDLKQNK